MTATIFISARRLQKAKYKKHQNPVAEILVGAE
jgi:hypothetical protein